MKYRHYLKCVEKVKSKKELDRLLKIVEQDNRIGIRKYEALRYLILKKIYSF